MLGLLRQAVTDDADGHLWALGIVLITGMFGLMAVVIPLLVSTRKQAAAANDAVNHRHLKAAPGEEPPPKAYDAILNIVGDVQKLHSRFDDVSRHIADLLAWRAEFAEAWSSLPENLRTGHQLAKALDDIVSQMNTLITPEELAEELRVLRARIEERPCLVAEEHSPN